MTIRSFIFSFLLLAYGVILGHEVVYGHHTSSGRNFHRHASDCCDGHNDDLSHLPCLIDIKPHIASSCLELSPSVTDFDSHEFDSFLLIGLGLCDGDQDCDSIPPDRNKIKYFDFRGSRRHSLRGPPLT